MVEAYHVYPSARCVGLSFTIDIIPTTINDKLSSFYQVLVHTRHPEDHSVQSPTAPSKALSPSGCSHCTELSIKVKYLISDNQTKIGDWTEEISSNFEVCWCLLLDVLWFGCGLCYVVLCCAQIWQHKTAKVLSLPWHALTLNHSTQIAWGEAKRTVTIPQASAKSIGHFSSALPFFSQHSVTAAIKRVPPGQAHVALLGCPNAWKVTSKASWAKSRSAILYQVSVLQMTQEL